MSAAENPPAETVAGEYVILRGYGLSYRKIDKMTAKQFQLGEGSARHPSRVSRDDKRIVCFASDPDDAKRLHDSIAGIDGEYNRRCRAANEDYRARCKAAGDARVIAIAKLLAERAKATKP